MRPCTVVSFGLAATKLLILPLAAATIDVVFDLMWWPILLAEKGARVTFGGTW